jgi:hypothetical protein
MNGVWNEVGGDVASASIDSQGNVYRINHRGDILKHAAASPYPYQAI